MEENNYEKIPVTIGIDPGTHTGLALYYPTKAKKLYLYTLKIHEAMEKINDMFSDYYTEIELVVIENPNQVRFFSDKRKANAQAQGAGSIKRDFKIWMDFLADKKIKVVRAAPSKQRNGYAKDLKIFERITGYGRRSSEHARCAAMLIWK